MKSNFGKNRDLIKALVLLSISFFSILRLPELMAATDQNFLLTYPDLENPEGAVVMENPYVVLQRLVVPAGKWEGIHSHPGHQLYVHIKGGEWAGRLGGELEYENDFSAAGSVGWMDAIPVSAGHNSGNTGNTDIDLIYVTLKDDYPIRPDLRHSIQSYPDIDLSVLLENEFMIVQRGELDPGQWTGVHNSPGYQILIQVKAGRMSERKNGTESTILENLEDGAASWLDATEVGLTYEFGNTGDTLIDFVLISLK